RRIFGCNLLLLIFTLPLTAQDLSVTGRVTDGNLPISGASIIIKNTMTGTVSDFDGRYSITTKATDTLEISYLGYSTVTVPVQGRRAIDVVLQEDATSLSEVRINAGYYTTTDRERTGSISKVAGSEIALQPVVSPLEALQGRMAGVSIVQRSGIPGVAATVQIRGQNSLRTGFDDNGNLPLYIIDGVPIDSSPLHSFSGMTSLSSGGIDPLNTLDLNSIESIAVLKDADATAIYGSRGANGVILITTKEGAGYREKTQINARIYNGVSQVGHFVNLLNSKDYLELRKEAFANDGVSPTASNAKDLILWDQQRNTDWQKVLFGSASTTTDANISLSGGNNNTNFRLSSGYYKVGTVFPGDFGYQKLTTGLQLNHRSDDDKFKMRLSMNYGVDENDQFNSNSFVTVALSLPPNAPELYDEQGDLNWENSTWTNPLAQMHNVSNAKVQQLISSIGITYELSQGLTIRTNVGYNILHSQELVKNPVKAYDPSLWGPIQHRSSHSRTTNNSWIVEPQLNYNKQIGNWRVQTLIGATLQQRTGKNLRVSGIGYPNEQLIGDLASANTVFISSNAETQYRYNAAFARVALDWKNKYILNLTGRRDGSSRFGPNRRFSNFGALGYAWIFSDEKAINERIDWLSFGKLRGSYGTTGSDQIGDYGYLDTYSSTTGQDGLYPTKLTNPFYSWETNKKFETALELGFLKNRLKFQLSWYRNRSSNQLVGYALPSMTGFTSVQANLPATVQNTGWEFEWNSLNIRTKNFHWSTSFNLTFPKNKLVSFPGIEKTSYANIYRVGSPLNISLLYRYLGVNTQTGLHEIEDINQDGSYDYEDRVVLKDVGRKFFGGIQNQISYKGFNLGMLLEFVSQQGQEFYRATPGRIINVLKEDFDLRWRSPGDDTSVQQASQSILPNRAYNNARNSNMSFKDASFIRIKSVIISYDLPLKDIMEGNCRLFVSGQNLWTITPYKGLDPQRPNSPDLPVLRTISMGMDINF
ncbi:MAG TPA: SusC/RagA family TonB-linked outer membrane protein, partial [Dysgonamonadaceae bacterium]|nr:SusC/RagA family TonB-linked outer membrane protein [Dysgonamonadaceae bacterium]